MITKGLKRSQDKRNFGLGAKPGYATKIALADMFGSHDHYNTRHTHTQRFKHFLVWLSELDEPIKDLRLITQAHLEAYAHYLAERVELGTTSVAYAQNLISTANTVMLATRRDRKIYLPPSEFVGARCYIRTDLPNITEDNIRLAVRLAELDNNPKGAAMILLARAFGMRLREAALANLNRLQSESSQFERVWILDGTKGGRRSKDRFVVVGNMQQQALDYALATIACQQDCLVDAYRSYRIFINQVINPMRLSLKTVGIRCFKDLRAQRMIDIYEEHCGQSAPLKQTGSFNRDADLEGRREVSREAGHGRIGVAASYIGKRARKDREAPCRESE